MNSEGARHTHEGARHTLEGGRAERLANRVFLARILNGNRKALPELITWQPALVTTCQRYRVYIHGPKRRGNGSKHRDFLWNTAKSLM